MSFYETQSLPDILSDNLPGIDYVKWQKICNNSQIDNIQGTSRRKLNLPFLYFILGVK